MNATTVCPLSQMLTYPSDVQNININTAGEIFSESEKRGKMEYDKRECFYIHFVISDSFSRSEVAKKRKRKKKKDQQIRHCRDRRKLGQVCSVLAEARDSPAFL